MLFFCVLSVLITSVIKLLVTNSLITDVKLTRKKKHRTGPIPIPNKDIRRTRNERNYIHQSHSLNKSTAMDFLFRSTSHSTQMNLRDIHLFEKLIKIKIFYSGEKKILLNFQL